MDWTSSVFWRPGWGVETNEFRKTIWVEFADSDGSA